MKSLIELTLEQLQYLKSLDSKKKKRKFLLDCLVEETEFKEEMNKQGFYAVNLTDGTEIYRKRWDLLEEPEKPKSFSEYIDEFISCENILKLNKNTYDSNFFSDIFKEIESKEILEKSKEPQPPTEFCVEITPENRSILEGIYCKQYNYEKIDFLGKYFCSKPNSFFSSDNTENQYPIVTTEEFLKYIGREDLISERTETQKINDLFFKELEVKRESLLSDVKKLFSDYENKEQGISVLCDLSKIGFFIDEDVLNKYHESAKNLKQIPLVNICPKTEDGMYKYEVLSSVELNHEQLEEITTLFSQVIRK